MMSAGIPFFEPWVALLLVGGVVYGWQNRREGFSGASLIEVFVVGAAALILSTMMFAALVIPGLWLWMFYRFARRMNVADPLVRKSSRLVLLAFVLTAGVGLARMKLQGEDYLLTRFHAGGPGQAFFSQAAKQQPFPADHLIAIYRLGNGRAAHNVLEVFDRRSNLAERPEEVLREIALLQSVETLYADKQQTCARIIGQYQKKVTP